MATPDAPGVILPPPIILLIAVVAGIALDFVWPWPFLPAGVIRVMAGAAVFLAGAAIARWSVRTMLRAGTRFETSKPSTSIVAEGPYRWGRNPIYTAMLLGLAGLAIALGNAWLLAMMIPFYIAIRYGVIAREEAYLERKFGADYLAYKRAVRRWI